MIEFVKSILAGIAIAIGAYINLNIGGVAGAVVFSVGLFLVCHFQLNLYTGKVGYTGIINNLPILLGNAIGAIILYFYPIDKAVEVVEKKLNTPLYITFINAFICGILIYAAVECFKYGKEYMVLLCLRYVFASGPLYLRYRTVPNPFLRIGEKWDLHRTCMGGRREELHWNHI